MIRPDQLLFIGDSNANDAFAIEVHIQLWSGPVETNSYLLAI